MRRSPEQRPINQEQNQETSRTISVEKVLEAIEQSSLLSIQRESLRKSILEIPEEDEEPQPKDIELQVVRAIIEGFLNIPIAKLEGKDRVKLEQELGRVIPGFTLSKV